MKLPTDLVARHTLYNEIHARCLLSRDERAGVYAKHEAYYLFGTANGQTAPYNKIRSTIEILASFLFAADSTTFSVGLEVGTPPGEAPKLQPASKMINERWLNSGSDTVFAQAVLWAEVYGSMIVKALPGGDCRVRTYCVPPSMFGVYEENRLALDEQEAFVHVYPISKPELERMLKDHPKEKEILSSLTATTEAPFERMDGLNRIILSSQAAAMGTFVDTDGYTKSSGGDGMSQITGNAGVGGVRASYNAKLDEETFELSELYVWDDEKEDYRLVTKTPSHTIYDRPWGDGDFGVKGESPFAVVCPQPKHDYFWGISDVEAVTELQEWLNQRMEEFANLLAKQVRPPKIGIGMTGLTDEKMYALDQIGGYFQSADPTGKLEVLPPTVPPELFKAIELIDQAFSEALSLPNVLLGKGESGVRSKGHAAEMARIASSRTKRKALVVEDALEKIGELIFGILRKFDDTVLTAEHDGKTLDFILGQMTDHVFVRVDAHGHSPLFAEELREMASFMLENHIIDRDLWVEITKPPMMDLIKLKLKDMQKAEAAAAQAEHAKELEKHPPPLAKPRAVG